MRSVKSDPPSPVGMLSVLLALISVITVALSACGTPTPEPGVLTGHVTIRPLVPVEEEGEPTPTPWPELYENRAVIIYDREGGEVIKRAEIDAEGNYRVELPPGTYFVDVERIGVETSEGLPTNIQVPGGESVRLDVKIDTGIR